MRIVIKHESLKLAEDYLPPGYYERPPWRKQTLKFFTSIPENAPRGPAEFFHQRRQFEIPKRRTVAFAG